MLHHLRVTSGDFMSHDGVYEDIQDIDQLKKHMKDTLDEYNNSPGVVNMNLVLFKDAIDHGESVMKCLYDLV